MLEKSLLVWFGIEESYPGIDLALVAANDVGDVALNDLGQSSLVVDVLNPLRELRVPDQSVSSDLEAILSSKVDDLVEASEVELALAGFSGIPLGRVLRRNGTKVGLDNSSVLGNAKEVRVGDGSVVELALVLDELVDAIGSLTGFDSRGNGRDQRGSEEEGRQLHCCELFGKG